MRLTEGPILIAQEDRELISSYLKTMKRYTNGCFKGNEDGINALELARIMANKSSELCKELFPFNIDYIFDPKKPTGWWSKSKNEITINTAHLGWIRSVPFEKYEKLDYFKSINYNKLIEILMHEFVHYIQHTRRQEKSGDYMIPPDWNDTQSYYKRPWEQQAHAIEYLEKLKQEMKIRKPEEILSQLRKMGVLHKEDLNKLKKADYKSWKAIMKQAIMTAVADLKDGEPLPWQK